MRLICPNCVAQYEVDENVIPPEGRDVQCANCGHNWFQDKLQMLSSDDETPSGTGDPDSDVPPELFNDLEGKLDTSFVSTRRVSAPDPNDMEPETPRDDFQIEQEPANPSSKLKQDALDILHAEAEYSSGEKPPAAVKEAVDTDEAPAPELVEDALEPAPVEIPEDKPEADTAVKDLIEEELEPVEETSYIPVEDPDPTPSEEAPLSEESDDLDEIRRRIMELETQETGNETPESEAENAVETPVEPTQPKTPEALDILDLDIPDFDPQPDPVPSREPQADPPFSRPTSNGAREALQTDPPQSSVEHSHEETAASIPEHGQTIDHEIEDLVTSQETDDVALNRVPRKVTARPFPNIGEADDLYGASDGQPPTKDQEHVATRKDMFQDVDELSSEIASEAEQGDDDHRPTAVKSVKKAKGSFGKGFKYALLLCILIGILYIFTPQILKQAPQAEGFLNIITTLVDTATGLAGSLIETIKGMIG
jgi:predicted Zn finger-like uncharacterized protein